MGLQDDSENAAAKLDLFAHEKESSRTLAGDKR